MEGTAGFKTNRRKATQDVWSQEQIHHQLGVTRGSLRSKGPERTSRFSR